MNYQQELEIKLRNEQAKIYDDIFFKTRGKYWSSAQINIVLHYLNLKRNQYILDAGCGTGIYSTEILKRNKNILIDAVDFSDSEIRIFKNKLNPLEMKRVKMFISDLVNFDYPESKYDRIFIIEVLQHIPTLEKKKEIIKKLYSATKKNGFLLSLNYLWGGFIKEPQLKEEHSYNNTGLYRFAFTSSELTELFNQSGFSKVKNINILKTPFFMRKYVPPKLSYFIERAFILSGMFGKKSKYIMTIAYKS